MATQGFSFNAHLPPHLREVSQLLAAGMVRLRSRTAEEFALEVPASAEVQRDFATLTCPPKRVCKPLQRGLPMRRAQPTKAAKAAANAPPTIVVPATPPLPTCWGAWQPSRRPPRRT
jgi:hypothetical protein